MPEIPDLFECQIARNDSPTSMEKTAPEMAQFRFHGGDHSRWLDLSTLLLWLLQLTQLREIDNEQEKYEIYDSDIE